ncbi:thiosulfate oxidation carrier complex protein SoxZ [Undibacterium terreum]|uniref:Thiosulfate oxidation carrier complex protein SoxZ n=1 Tax=Undibacterium terreum TaxID=1224302 RepID=A0A916XKU5_9BURK|nr:thiosulfate oxidation carrier complex protein SoxZ [Undibacterium terreum]GGC78236.1 thiosulfate oxidation carrier complex protein SoxZ [Undibacterium terreum]
MASTVINVPAQARRGEILEIRTLIRHPMETGFRPGADGRIQPRDIIQRFSCLYNGEQVFSAEMFSAVAANPYISFHTVATESGTLSFHWEGDNGFTQTETAKISVAD